MSSWIGISPGNSVMWIPIGSPRYFESFSVLRTFCWICSTAFVNFPLGWQCVNISDRLFSRSTFAPCIMLASLSSEGLERSRETVTSPFYCILECNWQTIKIIIWQWQLHPYQGFYSGGKAQPSPSDRHCNASTRASLLRKWFQTNLPTAKIQIFSEKFGF